MQLLGGQRLRGLQLLLSLQGLSQLHLLSLGCLELLCSLQLLCRQVLEAERVKAGVSQGKRALQHLQDLGGALQLLSHCLTADPQVSAGSQPLQHMKALK